MKTKRGPFILIALLLIVLIFIVGVRYGQRVQTTNKAISLILSQAPSQPTATSVPLRFSTYTSKGCGFEVLYPSTVDIVKESTSEAKLIDGGALTVAASCAKIPSFESFFKDKSVTNQSISFQKKSYPAKVRNLNNQKYFYIVLQNPLGKPVYLAVEEKFFPLVEKSFIFK